MIDVAAEPAVRLVPRPDRRQRGDRREAPRGGRRLADWVAFAISSGVADLNLVSVQELERQVQAAASARSRH